MSALIAADAPAASTRPGGATFQQEADSAEWLEAEHLAIRVCFLVFKRPSIGLNLE